MATDFPVLLPALSETGPAADRPALRFGDRMLTYRELGASAGALAHRVQGAGRVAVWATPSLETALAVTGALLAGVPPIPLNPKTGERELAHILDDSAPSLVLAATDVELPPRLQALARVDVPVRAAGPDPAASPPAEPPPESAALIVYTSGTTGPPKGAVLPRRALAATLDSLQDAWQWTSRDTVVQALPLFHVHGLILGVLGPLRRGGSVRHLVQFTPAGVGRALDEGATMFFGVPTMYHRLAQAVTAEPELARALARARLLVSGSAALPLADHRRLTEATGRPVIERYGMTETLMNTSVRAQGHTPRPGTVGVPLPGVELRLVDESGVELDTSDGQSIGEIQVRGPSLFSGYLNRPEATAAAFAEDGWFRTGDMAVRETGGHIRIVGRKATDLIKSGGYKIGAGEIENALLDHPEVREAAVTGEPDPDLGERIVAWVVPAHVDAPPAATELMNHVADQLAPHKRPRQIHFRASLPRNDLGKIMKRDLHA
ncbi:acyl-CoA synthetase [Streptomyces sp. NPDC006879]|uniref:acyl-CoA synthetase n=1 Tax=Streptomyces sp. NPDC006879 TaxID=3364767 RepID=UPI00367BFDE7